MESVNVPTNKQRATELIKLVIAEYAQDTGPGSWEIRECFGRPRVILKYVVAGPSAARMIDIEDSPWSRWGGNSILLRVGITDFESTTM
jgi:hypothetical protein